MQAISKKINKKGGRFRMSVWGSMSFNGLGELVEIKGNLNENKYKQLLSLHLKSQLKK
jgi:hypothetical protein